LKLKQSNEYLIRRIEEYDREWVQKILSEIWGSCRVVTRGSIHQADELPGFIAEIDGQRTGLLTWKVNENMLEIITMNALKQRVGIGSDLVNAAKEEAKNLTCSRVWVITTNDNVPAQKYYRALGFSIAAVHKDAVKESRKLKPEIPFLGIEGIPITDEIELEKILRVEN
jgi:ribosomal protein S18 acetylase RimI-like enzyme